MTPECLLASFEFISVSDIRDINCAILFTYLKTSFRTGSSLKRCSSSAIKDITTPVVLPTLINDWFQIGSIESGQNYVLKGA